MSYIAKVDQVLSRINRHPEYSACSRNLLLNSRISSSNAHSVAIELPDIQEGIDLHHYSHKNVFEDISEGWHYLENEGITKNSLYRLGRFIQPDLKSPVRTGEVIFGKFGGIPPENILSSLEDLEYRLNNYDGHPIARAVEAQVEMVRIHPYADGNGRASRLLQNFCLHERSYPVPIIGKEDKRILFSLLDNVFDDRLSGKSKWYDPSTSDIALRDYVASKIYESTVHIEEELKSKRLYKLRIDSNTHNLDPKQVGKQVRSRLRSSFSSKNIAAVAQIEDSNKNTIALQVKGNVSKEEIEESLKNWSQKKEIGFKVIPHGC
ncbi:MAG: Fic family protein [Candidatus Woesearchaeota archaeon]